MNMIENLHKVLSIGSVAIALRFSSFTDKPKHEIKDKTLHPNDPYCVKSLRFTEEEQNLIEPMIFLKNGSAKQFVGLIIKGIAKNREADKPIRVCDLIDEAEKLIMPNTAKFVQEHPGNKMFQENLDDLKTIVSLYRKVYNRTAAEDAAQRVKTESKLHLSKTYERRT